MLRIARSIGSLAGLFAASLALASCGGGGGGGSGGGGGGGGGFVSHTITLPLYAPLSGSVFSAGNVIPIASSDVAVFGDSKSGSTDLESRAFFTFLITSLPVGAVIESAFVEFDGRVSFGDPYGTMGPFVFAYHVSLDGGLGPEDFGSAGMNLGFVAPTLDGGPYRPAQFDVTTALESDWHSDESFSSFRVAFENAPSANVQTDQITVRYSPTDASMQPRLRVTYH
jgi:hypothetical protein